MDNSVPIQLKEAKSDGFTDSNRKTLYEAMWFDGKMSQSKSFDEVKIQGSKWRNTESKNSYRFYSAGEIEVSDSLNEKDGLDITCKLLERIFLDENNVEKNKKSVLFENKFMQACYGDGKEYINIAKMHSSSLCALLFFYGVSDNKSDELTLNLNGKDYIFTESVFEYKSPVLDSGNPSNMDVVLLGKDKDDKKVALFLESKFSEYIDCQTKHGKSKDRKTGDYKGIDKGYLAKNDSKPLYSEDNLKKMGLERKPIHEGVFDEEKDDFELCLLKGEETFYIHGIKQMISHYVGVKNVLSALQTIEKDGLILGNPQKQEKQDSQKRVNEYLDENTKIILGEILFDFPEDVFKGERDRYSAKYEELATIIKNNNDDKHFEMLSKPLVYSDCLKKKYKLDKNVKEYYGFNEE